MAEVQKLDSPGSRKEQFNRSRMIELGELKNVQEGERQTETSFCTDPSMKDYNYSESSQSKYYVKAQEDQRSDLQGLNNESNSEMIGDGLVADVRADVRKFARTKPIMEASEDMEEGKEQHMRLEEFDSNQSGESPRELNTTGTNLLSQLNKVNQKEPRGR